MRILLIGDLHVTNDNIEESKSLFDLFYDTALKYKPDFIVEEGDLLDGFGYPSVIAQNLIVEEFQHLAKICPVISLVGNHSFSPSAPTKHSLLPLKFLDNVKVIDSPQSHFGMDFMPFRRSKEQFIKEVNSLPNNILFCHQEFDGCEYENGWFSKDGVKPEEIKHIKVISGHIHKSGNIGQVWYTGSPRWLTKSDANQEKFIYLWDSEEDTHIKISTWPSAQKVKLYELTENDEIPSLDEMNTKYFVTLKGNFEFCQNL